MSSNLDFSLSDIACATTNQDNFPLRICKYLCIALFKSFESNNIRRFNCESNLPSSRASFGEFWKADRNLGAFLLVLLSACLNEVGIGRHLALGLPGVPFCHFRWSERGLSPLKSSPVLYFFFLISKIIAIKSIKTTGEKKNYTFSARCGY